MGSVNSSSMSPGYLHSAMGPPTDPPDGAESRYQAVQFRVRLGRVPDLQVLVSPSCGEAIARLKCTSRIEIRTLLHMYYGYR